MDDSEQPFVIESPTRIKLGPAAKDWAREWGMSDQEMAKYLLARSRQGDAESGQQTSMSESLGDASINIEDRRNEEPYADPLMTRINPLQQPLPQQVSGPGPMANQLGYGAIGASPPSQRQGQPFYPGPPQAFTSYLPQGDIEGID